MQELAKEYKQSLKLLNKRINELTMQKYNSDDHEKDLLKERLKPLLSMQKDTLEVTKVIENYSKRSYWRDEKYTCNTRKHRKFIYVEPIYD